MLLASCEKPNQIAALEAKSHAARTHDLKGLDEHEAKQILEIIELNYSQEQMLYFFKQYSGNISTLKMLAAVIKKKFEADATQFLFKETTMYDDIYQLLNEQYKRLSGLEKKIVYGLFASPEPITFFQLRKDLRGCLKSKKAFMA